MDESDDEIADVATKLTLCSAMADTDVTCSKYNPKSCD